MHARVLPFALREEARGAGGLGAAFHGGEVRLIDALTGRHGLHGHSLDHQRAALVGEAEAGAVGGLEGGAHVCGRSEVHDHGGVGAGIAHMGAAQQLALGVRLNLVGEIGEGLGAQGVHDLLGRLCACFIQRRLDGALTHGAGVGEAHAVGGEQAGERVDQDRAHAQGIGHEAGVLAARAAETLQGVVGDVIAALHGDFLDGVGHVLDGDADEAFRHFFGRARVASLRGERRKALPHRLHIEGLVAAGAEDLREEGGVQLADHHIGVGDRQRPAAPIAARSGIGASGIGAHDKAAGIRMQDRAAARRHRMNEHHGGAYAHARDFGFERALEFAIVVGDIR